MRVIGVGNILLTDEGIGVHVAAELEKRGALPGVEFVDGGVAGLSLLPLIEDQEKVVIVDAVAASFPPGTVIRLTPDDLSAQGASRCSLHDLNLSDTLGVMRLRGTLPDVMILGIVPDDIETYRIGLSETLSAKFGEILRKVQSEIAHFAEGER